MGNRRAEDLALARLPGPASKIIAQDTGQDEPGSPDRALDRAADLGLSDPRIVADRDFHDAKSGDRPFQDHFDRPAIRSFFKGQGTKRFGASGTERTEVADVHAIQQPDQGGRQAIAEGLVPGQRAPFALAGKARTEHNIGAPLNERSE